MDQIDSDYSSNSHESDSGMSRNGIFKLGQLVYDQISQMTELLDDDEAVVVKRYREEQQDSKVEGAPMMASSSSSFLKMCDEINQ